MSRMNTSRGFVSFGLMLVLIIGLAAFGGAGWYVSQKNPKVEAPTQQPDTNTGTQNASNPTTQSVSVATNPSYIDHTFGISFQYPKGFSAVGGKAIWTSKEAYIASQNAERASGLGRGAGVNNIIIFEKQTPFVRIELTVAPLSYYNAYGGTFDPETTDPSFVVNGVKVYTTNGETKFLWQNTHKPSLETLWNSISISGESAAEVSQVATLIQDTLWIK